MDNYNEDQAYRGGSAGALTPDAQEAKRLRNQLVEYDGYLQEMRKSNMKNVETLDVIQRYTDKSAAGIQKLTEESAAGMQKLAEESLHGVQKLAEECASGLRRYSADGRPAGDGGEWECRDCRCGQERGRRAEPSGRGWAPEAFPSG